MYYLFEPWGLGDALIAYAFVPHLPGRRGIICRSTWIPILKELYASPDVTFVPCDLPYAYKRSPLSELQVPVPLESGATLLSVRGDFRDYLSARKYFKGASIRMTGWIAFLAWRSRLVDAPFNWGLLRPQNRYEMWAALTGLALDKVCPPPEPLGLNRQLNIGIHIGAQWRSRQYPHVAELAKKLEQFSGVIKIMAGPGDQAPPGILRANIMSLSGAELVSEIRSCDILIANDSSPMHLAGFLQKPVFVPSRMNNMNVWGPPHVHAVTSPLAPTGYHPDAQYASDACVSGWPSADHIVTRIATALNLRNFKH